MHAFVYVSTYVERPVFNDLLALGIGTWYQSVYKVYVYVQFSNHIPGMGLTGGNPPPVEDTGNVFRIEVNRSLGRFTYRKVYELYAEGCIYSVYHHRNGTKQTCFCFYSALAKRVQVPYSISSWI